MPTSALRPCTKQPCRKLVRRGPCADHVDKRWSTAGVSRQSRGYGAEWEAVRREVIHAEHVCCVCGEALSCRACGQKGLPAQVDHRKPRAEGGTDDRENLRAICKDCHRGKSAREGARGRARATA